MPSAEIDSYKALLIRPTASKRVSGQLPHSRHRHQFRVQDREWQTSCPLHIKESPRPPSSASRLMSSLCSISPASIHRAGRRRPGNKWTGDWYL